VFSESRAARRKAESPGTQTAPQQVCQSDSELVPELHHQNLLLGPVPLHHRPERLPGTTLLIFNPGTDLFLFQSHFVAACNDFHAEEVRVKREYVHSEL
jgi:hypothetical protein